MFANSELRSSSYASKGSPFYSVNLVTGNWFNCHRNDSWVQTFHSVTEFVRTIFFFNFLFLKLLCVLTSRQTKIALILFTVSFAAMFFNWYCSQWVLLQCFKKHCSKTHPDPLKRVWVPAAVIYHFFMQNRDGSSAWAVRVCVFLPLERIGRTEHDQTAG